MISFYFKSYVPRSDYTDCGAWDCAKVMVTRVRVLLIMRLSNTTIRCRSAMGAPKLYSALRTKFGVAGPVAFDSWGCFALPKQPGPFVARECDLSLIL